LGGGTVRAGQPPLLGDRVAVARLGRLGDALEPALGLLEVGVDQFGLDRLDVVQRIDAPLGMHDVLVGVGADDVHERVGLADVGQKLVAQPLAAVRPGDEAGDVVEGDRVGHDLGCADDPGDDVETLVGHRHDRHVGLDRRERVVRGLGGDSGERREQR
jgi:hypothetical protein